MVRRDFRSINPNNPNVVSPIVTDADGQSQPDDSVAVQEQKFDNAQLLNNAADAENNLPTGPRDSGTIADNLKMNMDPELAKLSPENKQKLEDIAQVTGQPIGSVMEKFKESNIPLDKFREKEIGEALGAPNADEPGRDKDNNNDREDAALVAVAVDASAPGNSAAMSKKALGMADPTTDPTTASDSTQPTESALQPLESTANEAKNIAPVLPDNKSALPTKSFGHGGYRSGMPSTTASNSATSNLAGSAPAPSSSSPGITPS